MSSASAPHWAAIGETTFVAGIRLLCAVERWFGRWPFRLCLAPVVLCHWLFNRTARQASADYLQRMQATCAPFPRALPKACEVPEDLGAREEMLLAACWSGVALANAGLGAVHGFAGVVGGLTGAPHGLICATLLAPVCRANIAAKSPSTSTSDSSHAST